MAREFNIKTVTSTESITDLHVTVTTVFQDLLEDFTYTELLESESLFVLLSDSNIVAEDENGDTISGSIITSLEREKLEGVESGATADQSDVEIKTAYENNADTNVFTDADESKLDNIEANATTDQTDNEIETAYNNQVAVVSQPDAEAGTSTTVKRWTPLRISQAIAALATGGGGPPSGSAGGDLGGTYPNPKVIAITETSGSTSLVAGAIADGELLKRVGSTLVGYKPVIACCPFGAKSDSLGKFLIANGKSSDADDNTKPKTRQPIALDGTLTKLVYKTKDGSTSTRMKIHINGVVEETVVLNSMNGNDGGVETISVSVSAGDYAEIEYDASQKPGECTMYFIQEL
jgi:hypothetical protein